MSPRQHEQRQPDPRPEDDPAPPPPAAPQAQSSDVDSLLDEIDDVLETNAESFVRGFVQKGGQ